MGFAPPQHRCKREREREIITKDLRDNRVKSFSTVILLLFLLVNPKRMAASIHSQQAINSNQGNAVPEIMESLG